MGLYIFTVLLVVLTFWAIRAKYSDPEELKKWERKQMNRDRRMPWE